MCFLMQKLLKIERPHNRFCTKAIIGQNMTIPNVQNRSVIKKPSCIYMRNVVIPVFLYIVCTQVKFTLQPAIKAQIRNGGTDPLFL